MTSNIKKLNALTKTISNKSGLLFLSELDIYINTINEDSYLSKVLDHMYDSYENESIELVRTINRAKSDLDAHFIKDEIDEKIAEKYPLYSWKQLLKAQIDFQYIKNYETEESIPDIDVAIPKEETELGYTYPTKINLKRIPQLVELLGWKAHFEQFNKSFLNLIDEIETKGGIFSKYFDYNSDSGILYFKGIEIQINERKTVTNANHLLTYLFQNKPFEQHHYAELEEDKALLENKHWSSYHKACVDIQNKVSAKTGIGDFLDFNSGPKMYLRVNPLYSTYNS